VLREKLAVCTNWFPITCAYLWEGAVQQESETVLIVKARAGMREQIEAVARRHIEYTHFVGEMRACQRECRLCAVAHARVGRLILRFATGAIAPASTSHGQTRRAVP
jgi:Uncharacterized protein involved in tolerance to divalent cations, COG1324